MDILILYILPLWTGWILDRLVGDPSWLPHPIVFFGNCISAGEKKLNQGTMRMLKGAIFAVLLIISVFFATYFFQYLFAKIHWSLLFVFNTIIVFYCLSGKTLIVEVVMVFKAVNHSVEEGRKRLARIVGRDTSELSVQQIRTAALETLSENLSDGIIAPMFWYMLLGVPGMMAYKMINTLDSMIGYKTERYKEFGCWAAHIDDLANFIPSRITAILMALADKNISLLPFIWKFGSSHSSPNSGYPEAALAGILNCRFGGPNFYFGKKVDKPYIGENNKELTDNDMKVAVTINMKSELLMLLLIFIFVLLAMCIAASFGLYFLIKV